MSESFRREVKNLLSERLAAELNERKALVMAARLTEEIVDILAKNYDSEMLHEVVRAEMVDISALPEDADLSQYIVGPLDAQEEHVYKKAHEKAAMKAWREFELTEERKRQLGRGETPQEIRFYTDNAALQALNEFRGFRK